MFHDGYSPSEPTMQLSKLDITTLPLFGNSPIRTYVAKRNEDILPRWIFFDLFSGYTYVSGYADWYIGLET